VRQWYCQLLYFALDFFLLGIAQNGGEPDHGAARKSRRIANVSNASNRVALVHALMSVNQPDKVTMTLQLCSAIGATGTSQPGTD
jgi:hypothetical protein